MTIYIYGKNTVRESVQLNRCKKVFISSSFKDDIILNLIKKYHIPFEIKNDTHLSTLVKGNHQGIVAEVERYEYSSLEEIIHISKNKEHPLILILDEINDPGNFGAILRSADAFNVDGIIIKKHGQVLLNDTVAKTSTGAINYVKVCQVANLSQAIEGLKENGFWIVASDGNASQSYTEIKYDFPTALIIGSEGFGISPLLIKRSDFVIKIPMFGHVNSLNASVATGILLSHIRSLY